MNRLIFCSFRFLLFSLLILTISGNINAEDNRGLGGVVSKLKPVVIRDRSGKEVGLYRGSHALLVGVSDYTHGWPDLPGVKRDLEIVHTILEKRGFHVATVLNPNIIEMESAFKNFIKDYGEEAQNRLLFYFAGHGYTVKPKYGGDPLGYIVPRDAPNPKRDLSGFKKVAMSMQRIEEYALTIDAKHVLFLFDSCFSGSLFALSRAIPDDINYKTAKPVRQFITAGSAGETVPDNSIFCKMFVAALEGEGDVDQDGYVVGSELGEFLQKKVINYSKGSQHPQYGKIRNPNLDKGDFVFALEVDDGRDEEKELEEELKHLEAARKRAESQVEKLADKLKKEELKRRIAEARRKKEEAEKKLLQLAATKKSDSANNKIYVAMLDSGAKETGRDDKFIAYNNGVVYDTETGLEWLAGHDENTNWDKAKSWVERLPADGGRWRMPTRKELKSLYKEGVGTYNITPLLKTTGWCIWSGETHVSSQAWAFYFIGGAEHLYNRSYANDNRGFAVRNRRKR